MKIFKLEKRYYEKTKKIEIMKKKLVKNEMFYEIEKTIIGVW